MARAAQSPVKAFSRGAPAEDESGRFSIESVLMIAFEYVSILVSPRGSRTMAFIFKDARTKRPLNVSV